MVSAICDMDNIQWIIMSSFTLSNSRLVIKIISLTPTTGKLLLLDSWTRLYYLDCLDSVQSQYLLNTSKLINNKLNKCLEM